MGLELVRGEKRGKRDLERVEKREKRGGKRERRNDSGSHMLREHHIIT